MIQSKIKTGEGYYCHTRMSAPLPPHDAEHAEYCIDTMLPVGDAFVREVDYYLFIERNVLRESRQCRSICRVLF